MNLFSKYKSQLVSFFSGFFIPILLFYILYTVRIINVYSDQAIHSSIYNHFNKTIFNNSYNNNTVFNHTQDYFSKFYIIINNPKNNSDTKTISHLRKNWQPPPPSQPKYPLPPILPALNIGENEYPWKCIPHLFIPVRINQKLNAECMSFNEFTCLNTNTLDDCNLLISSNFTNISPLECGSKHLALYGISGYSNDTHWCYITLFNYSNF